MPGSSSASPHARYTSDLDQARRDEGFWQARARLASNLRLACFAILLVVTWLAFGPHVIARVWLTLPAMAFLALIVGHDRVLRRAERAHRTRLFFEEGLARLEDRWAGQGDAGERYRTPDHPYAADLDLFGTGSLFELLATTRTPGGSDRLAAWLGNAASPAEVRARQVAVDELRERLDLRLAMALAGEAVSAATDQPDALNRWAGSPASDWPRFLTPIALILSALSLGGLGLWVFTAAGPFVFLAALLIQTIFALALRGRVVPVLAAAETPVAALARTEALLACIEREQFEAPLLQALRTDLETTGRLPSEELGALRHLVDRRDARSNQLFAPIAALLLWGTHVAIGLERWRARCGPRLSSWVEAASEIEALCALAGYAWEHPEDPFPEIEDAGALFEGEAMGHPLLPADRCIRNDLALDRSAGSDCPQALVMSGSNMSGKSTMLRTVGCNAVLALAGAPVRAHRLRLSPLRITASIRIVDSLQQGQSHFMAEITRLRQVVEIARESPPAFFLLDEILHGTNSHDRRIGAEAVLRGLVELGALGIVTTHDLALTRIVDDSGGRLANVHFEDHLEDDAMAFDYTLREGVVEKSNALALMRAIGLEV